MIYEVKFTDFALEGLSKVPKTHQQNIYTRAMRLAENPKPPGCKKLVFNDDTWRIRVGDYRVIYEITETELITHVTQ